MKMHLSLFRQAGLALWAALAFLLTFGVSVTPALAGDNNVNWAQLGHNSQDSLYRYPQGPVPTNTAVTLRLRALNNDLTAARVRVYNDRVNSDTTYDLTRVVGGVTFSGDPNTYEFWEITLPASALPTVYYYRFIAVDGSATAYYEDDDRANGGWGTPYGTVQDRSWQLTMYDPAFATPDWVKNAVMYQIFVDRFRDGNPANNPAAGGFFYGANDTIVRSNGTDWNTRVCDPRSAAGSTSICANAYSQNFYGGDLQGVIDQLAYIDSLGVTALYLNPIFEAPSNHKYDATNFLLIDDNFGDLAKFQELSAAADALGIRIVLDGVFNHSSSDSIYFDRYARYPEAGACETTASPYINWYPFKTYTGGGVAPCSNNRDYDYWFGIFDSLAVYNHDNADVRNYFLTNGTASVAPYWMQWADGWRLDVAPEIDHGTLNDPADTYMETLRAAVRAVNPDTYIVGEEWGNATSWTIDNQWDATMNYQYSSAFLSFFRDENFVDNDHNSGSSAGVLTPLSPSFFNERILNWQERYAPEAYQAMMNLLGSHDTSRALFMLDHNTDTATTGTYNNPNYDWSDAIARLKGVTIAQLTMPGAPTIYYGDEVGTVNPPTWDGSQWQDDPYNRVPYPWLDQPGTPYYAHMQNTTVRNDLFGHYQTLTGARNSHPALRTGDLIPLVVDDGNGVYAYLRLMPDDSDAALVILNNSSSAKNVTVDLSGYAPANSAWTELFSNAVFTADANADITVTGVGVNNGAVLFPNSPISGRPAAITALTALPGNAQVALDWPDVSGAASYNVYRSPLRYGGWQFLANTATSAYTNTGLNNATTTYYVVVPVSSSGLTADYSNEASGTPLPSLSGAYYNLQFPYTINHTLSATTPTTTVYGQIYIGGLTDARSTVVPGVRAQVGFGPPADAPSSASWSWSEMIPNPGYDFGQNNDEYQGSMLPTQAGTFKYTTRWSSDNGATWYYTDRNGAPYSASDAGDMTVNPSADSTAPSVPTGLAVTSESPTGIGLAWTQHPNGGGDFYALRLYRALVTGGVPGAPQLIATFTNIAATSTTDSTVTTGQEVQYTLVAVDTSFNASAPSSPANGTASFPVVTVTATDDAGAESPSDALTFRVSRTGSTSQALAVTYIADGTAQAGDYTPALTGMVTIPAASAFADITLTPVDDADVETPETVILTLTDGATYDLGSPFTATATISSEDAAPGVTINNTAPTTIFNDVGIQLAEGATIGDRFTLSLPVAPMAAVTVTVSSSSPADFRFAGGARWAPVLTRSITFQPGIGPNDNVLNWNDTFTLSLVALEDGVSEGMETHQVLFTFRSSDPAYNGLVVPPVDVAVYDAGVSVSNVAPSVNEGLGGNYSVVLTAPPGLSLPSPAPEIVTVTLTPSGSPLNGLPATLTFTRLNWNVPQTVNFTVPDDGIINPLPYQTAIAHGVSSNIGTATDSRYGGAGVNVTAPGVTVTILDDEGFAEVPPLVTSPALPLAPSEGYVAPDAVEILPEPGS